MDYNVSDVFHASGVVSFVIIFLKNYWTSAASFETSY